MFRLLITTIIAVVSLVLCLVLFPIRGQSQPLDQPNRRYQVLDSFNNLLFFWSTTIYEYEPNKWTCQLSATNRFNQTIRLISNGNIHRISLTSHQWQIRPTSISSISINSFTRRTWTGFDSVDLQLRYYNAETISVELTQSRLNRIFQILTDRVFSVSFKTGDEIIWQFLRAPFTYQGYAMFTRCVDLMRENNNHVDIPVIIQTQPY